jgi:cell division protein FtsI/penicillin-binding protein 2
MLWRGRLTIALGASAVALLCVELLPGEPEAGSVEAAAALDRAASPPAATSPERDAESAPVDLERQVAPPAAPTDAPAVARLAAPAQALAQLPVARLRKASMRGELARVDSRLSESIALPGAESLQVEYTLDPALTDQIFAMLRRGRVSLGLAIVLDARSGDVLAYAGTDEQRLPAGRAYPAASLVKIVTAAAAIEQGLDLRSCRFVGSPYRLTPSRILPPRGGTQITLERALATSNNQCFAQLAAGPLGSATMLEAIERFGLLDSPAPGHDAGRVGDPGEDRYQLGKLGCGLAGLQITALHAAQLGVLLADGTLPESRWIARVRDPAGRELALPARPPARRVLDVAVARRLRRMMEQTVVSGTARSAFRRNARGLVTAMPVAAKTGSLSGKSPAGRYEWFVAAAPADRPRIAVAVLVVQGRRWWTSGSQLGAQILSAIFCERRTCSAALADRFGVPASATLESRSVDARPPRPRS